MESILNIAKEVIITEVEGLNYMSSNLGSDFGLAINAIVNSNGRVIVCGMGKSGIIGKKISASLASTGTPSFFMHPGEAFHGDLGMIKTEDVFIAISNSGETDEVLKLMPFLHENGNYVISITGNTNSTLALNSNCHLDISVPQEACPLQLAPTSSTTATLVMGDAITVCLMKLKGFNPENFARFHPGGSLGRRLLSKVKDEMHSKNLPFVYSDSDFSLIVNTISTSHLGLTLVKLDGGVVGVITDGDLRRAIESKGREAFDLIAMDIASHHPISISPDVKLQEAYEVMEDNGISSLLVKENNFLLGILKK